MRFTISSSALSTRLQTLARVINSKNSLPILGCFLFEVDQDRLYITASDSENVMRTNMAIDEVDGSGSFAVKSDIMLNSLKELPEQPLTFTVDLENYTIMLEYQNGDYNFTAQNAEEFPRLQSMHEGATVLSLPAAELSTNIARTLFATALDEIRPVMNGIYFDLTPDCLAIVASDGRKLVRNRILNIKSETPSSFILPKKPAMLLNAVLPKEEGDVVIKYDDRNAEISFASGTLNCRLIEGRYPNYNSVIPENNPNQLTVDRKALLGALRRTTPFAASSTQLIKFHLQAGLLTITSEDIQMSTSAKEKLVCEYNGQPMEIGFKGSALTEILTNLDSDEVLIALADPSRAGTITPMQQPENENVLMLFMPMLID